MEGLFGFCHVVLVPASLREQACNVAVQMPQEGSAR
jgi:hypothetical protein